MSQSFRATKVRHPARLSFHIVTSRRDSIVFAIKVSLARLRTSGSNHATSVQFAVDDTRYFVDRQLG
jgi:hypothetical protein